MYNPFLMSNSSLQMVFNKQPCEYNSCTVLSGKINGTTRENDVLQFKKKHLDNSLHFKKYFNSK